MTYQWNFKQQFAIEFARFPNDLQIKVISFTDIFEQHGLTDFTKYPGKIAPSWKGLVPSDPVYKYTFDNDLWHYHIGHPTFKLSVNGSYRTSDWVLHFQWKNKGNEVTLIDVYSHYRVDGTFYIPPVKSLD